jgi:hypothetical protein
LEIEETMTLAWQFAELSPKRRRSISDLPRERTVRFLPGVDAARNVARGF